MKKPYALLWAVCCLFLFPFTTNAQVPSAEGSEYTYIYKLEKEQVRWMIDSAWLSEKSPLNSVPIDSIHRLSGRPKFNSNLYPRGYYLSLQANDLMAASEMHTNQPFFPLIQETNGQWWFVFKDTLQSILKNGTLTMIQTGEKDTVFQYDSSCMCYQVPLQKHDRWFLFESGDNYYYLNVASPYKKVKKECARPWWKFWKKCHPTYYSGGNNYYYKPKRIRRFYNWVGRKFTRPTTAMQLNPGYIVINQPEFKHYDTLKMKAFLVNRKGKPLKKDLYVKVERQGYANQRLLWQKIKPLTRGAYAFDLAIPDSFIIDQSYFISVCDKRGRPYKNQFFKVADYELKKVSYKWENPRSEYYRGNDIIFYAKSVDANNLPLPDATVRLKLWIRQVMTIYDTLITYHDTVFTRYYDTLLACSPDGLTPIRLPAHLVKNADIYVYGKMEFTNADNQPGEATANFYIMADSKRYFIKQDSNGLSAGYLVQGNIVKDVPALWRVEYTSGVKREKDITLPYYQDWEPGATRYVLMDTSGKELTSYSMPSQIPQIPSFLVSKTYDSVHVELQNPLGIEVGWRISYGKKEIKRGAGSRLGYHTKLKGTKPVYVVYSYTWAGNFYTYETVAWVKEKQLTVKINQPEIVYPGQEIAVDITVTDYKNRGANNVNLTAYSVNMEFDNITTPNIPYYGKSYGGKLTTKSLTQYISPWKGYTQFTKQITPYLYNLMGLAKHPYYRLMYNPNALGKLTDSLTDNKTQLSVFVKNISYGYRDYFGLWIDDEMVYYNLSQQTPNAYRVTPGKHRLKIRAYEGIYETDSIDCAEGMRTLLGINLDSIYFNKTISRVQLSKQLETAERELYKQNVLYITGNIQYNAADSTTGGYLRQDKKIYRISHFAKAYTKGNEDKVYNNQNYYYKIGPFEKGWVELILGEKIIRFYFDPAYLYLYRNGVVTSHDVNYDDLSPVGLMTSYRFKDTATELPPPPKEEPTVNIIKNYATKNPFDHPGIRNYGPQNWIGRGSIYNIFTTNAPNIRRLWFINNDSLELSTIVVNSWYNWMGQRIIPGNYDILLINDTNSYKLMRNVRVTDSIHVYYKPTNEGFEAYESAIIEPYIEKVKLLNRGPIPEFYKSPVRLIVNFGKEPAKHTEKVIGEVSINGQHISNALVVIEDGRGNYVNGGLTNQYGFYQVPLNPGNYLMKIYTTQWDMFYVENIKINPRFSTLAHLNINNYSAGVAVKAYNYLPVSQRQKQLGSKGQEARYGNTVTGTCSDDKCGEIRGIVKDAANTQDLAYTNVYIEGTAMGTITDDDGSYRFKNLSPGTYNLVFTYTGYESQKVTDVTVSANGITYLNIRLRENQLSVGEVLTFTNATTINSGANSYNWTNADSYASPEQEVSLASPINRMMVSEMVTTRGRGKFKKNRGDVDGAEKDMDYYDESDFNPFRGNMMADSTSIHSVDRQKESNRLQNMLGDSNALQVRKNFRDYGYWIPNMLTNRSGKAGFTVKLPDNQTQWLTYVPAMDGKTRSGLGTAYMKAYKPLTGNLSVPRVMVAGDRLLITGKTVNYTADSVVVDALLKVNNTNLFSGPMGLRYYQMLQEYLQPQQAGEVAVQYSIKTASGYTDGEIRPVPVLENGLLVNDGETRTLEDDVAFSLLPQDGVKNRELLISNRKADMLLAEIRKLRNYQYGCVEQTASKLKALLLEKQFAGALGVEFKDEKEISLCIKKLEKYQNTDGSWGWWNRTATDNFMSIYATDALIRATKAGYRTKSALSGSGYLWINYYRLPIPSRINSLELFINAGYGMVTDKIAGLDTLNLTLQERYGVMKAKQASGIKINTAEIVKAARVLSNKQALWGEKVFSISVNELQTSAVAYTILRNEGGHEELLKKVRNYFLSIPHTARNTIESATLLQTFMQDITDEDTKRQELVPEFTLNGKSPALPLKMDIADDETVALSKKGSELFYLYSWQKFVANPETLDSVFNIKTSLVQGDRISDTLDAGKPFTLRITLTSNSERDYVMLEVPIPAGCSYQNKNGRSAYEVHREHFDDKVSIFFNKLPRGRYTFEVQLLPKFKGEVTLLPARAEEMYFPLHFGNNTKRTVVIR